MKKIFINEDGTINLKGYIHNYYCIISNNRFNVFIDYF